jgi:hypothetical protein
LAAQTVLPKKDVSIGASLMFFSQILGGAIFLSVGQNVLNNQLVQRLSIVPGFSPALIQSGGATELIGSFPAQYRHDALVAYNESLRMVFRVGLILAALSVIGAAGMEWRSVKKEVSTTTKAAAADVEKGTALGTTDESRSDGETLESRSTHRPEEKLEPASRSRDTVEASESLGRTSIER